MTGEDLIVLAVPGVQQFLTWSRSTADVAGASTIVSHLVSEAAATATGSTTLVMPTKDQISRDRTSIPNRLVATAPAGAGSDAAARMAQAIERAWQAQVMRVTEALGKKAKQAWRTATSQELGFPAVRWVVVPPRDGGYAEQWERAQQAMDARKRIRDFPPIGERGAQVCTVTGRWPAVDSATLASLAVRTRRGEVLSVPAVVKRHAGGRFPSTWSVATGPFRREVIDASYQHHDVQRALSRLRKAVEELARHHVRTGSGQLPGLSADAWLAGLEGAWLIPESWDADSIARDDPRSAPVDVDLSEGRQAATELILAARQAGISAPTPYLAVVVQDADSMGKRLGRPPADGPGLRDWHARVSSALAQAARDERRELESGKHVGLVVYAGGDDLLGLVPAATALPAARDVNAAFVAALSTTLPRATASTAVLFFHASAPLQPVLSAARELLDEAKDAGRPGLGVAVLHRGGERSRFIRRWAADPPAQAGTPAITQIQTLAGVTRHGLSGRLASRLERDADPLAELSDQWRRRELARLVWRHSGKDSGGLDASTVANVTDALLSLGAADAKQSVVFTVARFAAGIERD